MCVVEFEFDDWTRGELDRSSRAQAARAETEVDHHRHSLGRATEPSPGTHAPPQASLHHLPRESRRPRSRAPQSGEAMLGARRGGWLLCMLLAFAAAPAASDKCSCTRTRAAAGIARPPMSGSPRTFDSQKTDDKCGKVTRCGTVSGDVTRDQKDCEEVE